MSGEVVCWWRTLGLRRRMLTRIHDNEKRGIIVDKASMDYLLISRNARNKLLDVHVYTIKNKGFHEVF